MDRGTARTDNGQGLGRDPLDLGKFGQFAEGQGQTVAQRPRHAFVGHDADFQIGLFQIGTGSGDEGTAVMTALAGHGHAAFIGFAVGANLQGREIVAHGLTQAFHHIGQFAGGAFKGGVDAFDHPRIQTGPGHQQKMAAIGHAQMNLAALTRGDGGGDFLDVLGVKPDFDGQHIGGAQGNDPQTRSGSLGVVLVTGQTVDHFIDGAVAAGGDDHVEIFIDRPPRHFLGVALVAGMAQGYATGEFRQSVDDLGQAFMAPPSGDGIEDDQDSPPRRKLV